jgi:hypothetical protein
LSIFRDVSYLKKFEEMVAVAQVGTWGLGFTGAPRASYVQYGRKSRDTRWMFQFSKAKPKEDGSTPPIDQVVAPSLPSITSMRRNTESAC